MISSAIPGRPPILLCSLLILLSMQAAAPALRAQDPTVELAGVGAAAIRLSP